MRPRLLFPAGFLLVALVLVANSPPRMLGDSGDYVVMALNLVRGEAPSLSPDDLQRAAERYPGDVSRHLIVPEYRGIDGRQDLPHFWFYPLLAAPFVRVAIGVGADPIRGFTALNVILLALAGAVLVARQRMAVALLVAAGPILWWIDKAQTEVFTFSLITIAIALLRTAPWWSAVALGAASTQNPPLAGAMLVAIAYGAAAWGWRERRVWQGAAAGCVLAALHPFYYHLRLDMWSALRVGIDPHWPDLRELLTTAIDPNLGIFVHDVPITIAVIAAVVMALSDPRRAPRRLLHGERAAVLVIAALFLVSFTQTTNVNSGGTPGPSRYGLWLIPLTLPALATVAADASWLRALAAVSLVWCGILFAPQRAEKYVSPSRLASTLWEDWPGVDNPVAEVFAERAGGREPAPSLPIANASCTKLLVAGTGSGTLWPSSCGPAPIEVASPCSDAGTLCYANRNGSSYAFVRAPFTPYWRAEMTRLREGTAVHHETPIAAYALPPEQPGNPVAWLGAGWSYIERIASTGMAWRWMGERADVHVLAPTAGDARIRIVARAFGRTRRLRLSIDGVERWQFTVSENRAEFETPDWSLPAGPTLITFESLDGTDAAGGGDARRLSIALFHFEVVSADPPAAPR